MNNLRIIDTLSDPGSPDRVNEDAFGHGDDMAFVIDGATGLGDCLMGADVSDAAWLARLAAHRFQRVSTGDGHLAEAIYAIGVEVRDEIARATGGERIEPWQLPVAGFQMISRIEAGVRVDGLGDCRLFFVDGAGGRIDRTALPHSFAAERNGAAHAARLVGPLGGRDTFNAHPQVLSALRENRARYNRQDGTVWTLGAVPEAADHIVSETIVPEFPVAGLLCTDGFAALVDAYGRYDTATFVQRAQTAGLRVLLDELRHIERADPDCMRFPRYKRSDDATAILFEIT